MAKWAKTKFKMLVPALGGELSLGEIIGKLAVAECGAGSSRSAVIGSPKRGQIISLIN